MGQGAHYDQILIDYDRHYYDRPSMEYRNRYIYDVMFSGLDLNGKRVCELASGSGHNTVEVLRRFPRAELFGLDISPKSCAAYEALTSRPCHLADLSDDKATLPEPADVAFVVGGIHHCVHNLPATLENVARLVRPGGLFIMVEPNALFALNRLRELWYRKDHWFREQEEAPLVHATLADLARERFTPLEVRYLGGPAYFLILNSLVMRVPVSVKAAIAPALFLADDVYNRLPGIAPFPMFIARWRASTDVTLPGSVTP